MIADAANSLTTEREALDRLETLLGFKGHLLSTAFDDVISAAMSADAGAIAKDHADRASATIVIAQDYLAEMARIVEQLSQMAKN